MSRFRVAAIALLTLILGWQLGIGYAQRDIRQKLQQMNLQMTAGSGSIATDPEKEVDISLLWTVWRTLLSHYIDPQKLQTTPLLYGAAEGLVQAVGDPYTVFMTPPEDQEFRDTLSGDLQGIGAELSVKDGLVTVVAPLKGSPAEKAGLQPGDIIVAVDSQNIDGLSLEDVVNKVRGPAGTTVSLRLMRLKNPNPIDLSIVRAAIHVPSVSAKLIESPKGPFGYIELNQFGDQSVQEFKTELSGLLQKGVKGIIMDLRGNGGGYLDGAVELVSLFQKDGLVVSVEQRGMPIVRHSVTGSPLAPDMPLVVLQNEGSASASEITSGALQDTKRATIIGKKSFGKGTVQEVIALPGGSSLRVTIARWLTPKGKNLGKEGVHPDVEVLKTAEDVAAGKDPQLDAAVLWLSGNTEGARALGASSSSVSSGSH